MKTNRLKAIILITVMTLICAVFSSCGTNLAASASGIKTDDTEEVSTDIDEYETEYSEEAEEDIDAETDDVEDTEIGSDDSEETYAVILNSNPSRMRYHMPSCRGVDEISDEHYQEYELTIEEIKDMQDNHGWIACGWCHPDKKLGIE